MNIIFGIFSLVKEFSLLYKDNPSFPELFLPIRENLKSLDKYLPTPLLEEKKLLEDHLDSLSKSCQKSRKPLQYLITKPVELPLLDPLIYHDDGIKGNILHTDENRVRQRIIRNKLKREKRALIREIRADNRFLRSAREDKEAKEELIRKEKYKEVIKHLEQEQHMHSQLDLQNLELMKQRRKMRKNRKKFVSTANNPRDSNMPVTQ